MKDVLPFDCLFVCLFVPRYSKQKLEDSLRTFKFRAHPQLSMTKKLFLLIFLSNGDQKMQIYDDKMRQKLTGKKEIKRETKNKRLFLVSCWKNAKTEKKMVSGCKRRDSCAKEVIGHRDQRHGYLVRKGASNKQFVLNTQIKTLITPNDRLIVPRLFIHSIRPSSVNGQQGKEMKQRIIDSDDDPHVPLFFCINPITRSEVSTTLK